MADEKGSEPQKKKHVKLESETKTLLNQAKAKILSENPSNDWVTDDETIRTALKAFLGGAK